jgi:hypothetical protein
MSYNPNYILTRFLTFPPDRHQHNQETCMHKEYHCLFILLLLLITMPLCVIAQGQNQTETTEQDETTAPERVDVAPVAEDSQIRDRLAGF